MLNTIKQMDKDVKSRKAAKTNKFSVKARANSFVYALSGIKYFFKTQHNSWIQLTAATAATAAGFNFKINTGEWCWIISCIGAVFAAELFNTAIEALTDLVSPGRNEIAGRVKDLAAGAVLVTSIIALVIGLMIFVPKMF